LEQIARLIGATSLIVALLFVSEATVAAPAHSAPTDECLAAPNGAAPLGKRWYYKLDWETQRKCWYLRAPGEPIRQEALPVTPPKSPHLLPVPSAPAAAVDNATISLSTGSSAPHVEMPSDRPTGALGNNISAKDFELPAAHPGQPSTPEIAIVDAPASSPPKNAASTDAYARIKAQDVPSDTASMPDYVERVVRNRAQTKNAGLPPIAYAILALGSVIGAFLLRRLIKKAIPRSVRIFRTRSTKSEDQSQPQALS
jgi:hypothetical protein